MAACDYCEAADACAAWQEDESKPKPAVGACDFDSHQAYAEAIGKEAFRVVEVPLFFSELVMRTDETTKKMRET